MLVGLRIQNIALIESIDLAFEKGLTVVTGETGAGKSILLDALDALFAGNNLTSSSKFLREGADHALIEAIFLPSKIVKSWLKQQQIDFFEDELVLSREWHITDQRLISRFRLNGLIINKGQVVSLRSLLIDFTFQGSSQRLSKQSYQLSLLDDFGLKSLNSHLSETKKAWKDWKESFDLLSHSKALAQKLVNEREEHLRLLNELEAAQIYDPKEDINLQQEEDRLVNGVRLEEGLNRLMSFVRDGIEESPSVDHLLSLVIQELRHMSKFDSSISTILDKFIVIDSSLQDLIGQLDSYSLLLDSDSQKLGEIQDRIQIIKRLKRIHGFDLPELIMLKERLNDSLCNDNSENHINDLIIREKEARKLRDIKNHALTQARKIVAQQLEINLMKYLAPMGLDNVRFAIHFDTVDPSSNGTDSINFMFSANTGSSMAPLSEIASGGEMSRFLLALKATLSHEESSGTFVFDEIDSGVSGRVSNSVSSILKDLSKFQQVLCVTHQPIVAAAADVHLAVNKTVVNGRTSSKVRILRTSEERQKELAELAGGDVADASSYAASLLEHHAA